jgi:hypothetical protein
MSLLGWLGKEAKPIDMRSLSPIRVAAEVSKRVVLGVLGTRNNIRDMDTLVIGPIVEAWGLPDEIILPFEGESSAVLQEWATSQKIPVRMVQSDWAKQGRRAGLLRDACIQREATHLVLLQGPRSNALSGLAARLSRKGRNVVISERPAEPVKILSS